MALSRPIILLNGYPISFPLFVMSGIAVYRLVVFAVVTIDETTLNLRRSGVMDWILITPTSIYELFFVRSFLCSIIQQVSCAFGGGFFPVYLFPKVISFIPQVLPINHALNIVRFALTHTCQSIPSSLFSPLLTMALIYFVLDLFVLQKSLCYARQNGILIKDLHE